MGLTGFGSSKGLFVGAGSAGCRVTGRGAIAVAVLLLALVVPTAVAAPVPGTVDPVAPGVPGYGRAWELVTSEDVVPARLAGIVPRDLVAGVARSGDRLVYRAFGSLPDASQGPLVTINRTQRGPTGWTNQPLALPYPQSAAGFAGLVEGPRVFDTELTGSVWLNTLPAAIGGTGLFASAPGDVGGPFSMLIDTGDTWWSPFQPRFLAASADLERIVFPSYGHLLPADAARTSGTSLYELDGSTLRLLDSDNAGSVVSTCGVLPLTVSRDALQVLFTTPPECGSPARLYLWADGHTTEISASRCTLADCGPEADSFLAGRSADGTAVFLRTKQRLTNEDDNESEDIYRYDVAGDQLSMLYARPPAAGLMGFDRTLRASADGSRVYFIGAGQLIPGLGGTINLYLEDDQGLHFLAPVGEIQELRYLQPEEDDLAISADGRYAVFLSLAQLLPGDSDESVDAYRYDAVSGELTQVSAGVGGRGNGPFQTSLVRTSGSGADDIGPRVFFNTPEALVPADRNAVNDVYEWTEAGLGLVSGGVPNTEGGFLTATADGRSVFFRTTATLLPRDRDGGEADIYVARMGGGFAEPEGSPGCAAESCRGPESSGPGSRRTVSPGAPRASRIELARIDAAARRRLAARGSVELLVEVPGPGRLAATGTARIGSRRVTAATGGVAAKEAGPVRLRLRLAAAARRALAGGSSLRIALVFSQPAQGAVSKALVRLGGRR